MPLTIDENKYLENILKEAGEQLKDYPIMPEHYSTILKHPNMDPKGYYSEIDFEIGARLKRCETFLNTKGILEKAAYDHLYKVIEDGSQELQENVRKISMQHRLLTRAERLCKDDNVRKEIQKRREALEQDKSVKTYSNLITALECYAGVHEGKMPLDALDALEGIGYRTHGETPRGSSYRLKEFPPKIKINFRNTDEFNKDIMVSHPTYREKRREGKESFQGSEELFKRTVNRCAEDACRDTLNVCASNMEERLDFLIINGQTLREMIEEKTGKKELSTKEIEVYSCEYVTAALKSGGRVEVFPSYHTTRDHKSFRSEPVVIEGSKPKERITLNFWQRWVSKLGFYKEKVEQYKAQKAMDGKMAECRNRVRKLIPFKETDPKKINENLAAGKKTRYLTKPLTQEERQEKIARTKLIEKYKDDFIKAMRMNEEVNWHRDRMLYSFYPEDREKREGVKIEATKNGLPQLLRDRPLIYAVVEMLDRGYSMEQVMDPNIYAKERAEIGQQFREKYAAMTLEEYNKYHVDAMIKLSKHMPELIQKMNKEVKTKEDLRENFSKYYLTAMCMQVIQMDRPNEKDGAKYAGGKEEYEKLTDQLRRAESIYDLKNKYCDLYQNFHKVLEGDNLDLNEMAGLQMHEELIIKGLKMKEPSLSPAVSEAEIRVFPQLMQMNKNFVDVQQRANQLDETVIDGLLKNQGQELLNIQVEASGKEMTCTKDNGMWSKGDKITMNVSIQGEKIVEVEDPELDNLEMGDEHVL